MRKPQLTTVDGKTFTLVAMLYESIEIKNVCLGHRSSSIGLACVGSY